MASPGPVREHVIAQITREAAADLSAKQYFLVYAAGNGTVNVAGTTNSVIGVLKNAPVSGAAAEVQILGVAKAIAGGTVAAGDRIGPDGSGESVAKTADTNLCCGIALTDAADGECFELLLTPGCQRAS